MKKLILFGLLLFLVLSSFGQKITYKMDEMTDQYSYTFYTSNDKNTCLVSEDGNSGFLLSPWFKESSTKKLSTSLTFWELYVLFNIENVGCVEHGNLIIKFTDGTKISLSSSNGFNCKNYFLFFVVPKDRLILSSKPINKIMLTDFTSGISYTFSPDNSNFFIELNQAIGTPYTSE